MKENTKRLLLEERRSLLREEHSTTRQRWVDQEPFDATIGPYGKGRRPQDFPGTLRVPPPKQPPRQTKGAPVWALASLVRCGRGVQADGEYSKIAEITGRQPTMAELSALGHAANHSRSAVQRYLRRMRERVEEEYAKAVVLAGTLAIEARSKKLAEKIVVAREMPPERSE